MNKQQLEAWINGWKVCIRDNAHKLDDSNQRIRETWHHTLGYQYRMLSTLVTDMNKGWIDPVNPLHLDETTYDILKRHGIIPDNEPAVEKWLAK